MWWAGKSYVDVYVGMRRVAACGPQTDWVSPDANSTEQSLEAFAAWMRTQSPGRVARVWLGGACSRPFLVPTMPPLPREQAEMALQALAASRTGQGSFCRVWCEPSSGPSSVERVGVATDPALIDGVLHHLAARRWRCSLLQPWWAEALRHLLASVPEAEALAVQDCSALTILAGPRGQVTHVSTVAPVLDHEVGRASLRRLLAGMDVDGSRCAYRRLVFDNRVGQAWPGLALAPLVSGE